jgi:hypothetical protein
MFLLLNISLAERSLDAARQPSQSHVCHSERSEESHKSIYLHIRDSSAPASEWRCRIASMGEFWLGSDHFLLKCRFYDPEEYNSLPFASPHSPWFCVHRLQSQAVGQSRGFFRRSQIRKTDVHVKSARQPSQSHVCHSERSEESHKSMYLHIRVSSAIASEWHHQTALTVVKNTLPRVSLNQSWYGYCYKIKTLA